MRGTGDEYDKGALRIWLEGDAGVSLDVDAGDDGVYSAVVYGSPDSFLASSLGAPFARWTLFAETRAGLAETSGTVYATAERFDAPLVNGVAVSVVGDVVGLSSIVGAHSSLSALKLTMEYLGRFRGLHVLAGVAREDGRRDYHGGYAENVCARRGRVGGFRILLRRKH